MSVRWKTSLQWLGLALVCWGIIFLSWCATRLPLNPHT